MKLNIEIPKYKPIEGIKITWENGCKILTIDNHNNFVIKANSAGLVSLAKHLLTLAEEDVPSGSHIHYDQGNSLEENSVEMIFEKSKRLSIKRNKFSF